MKTISWNLEKSTPGKTGGGKDSSQKRTDRSFRQKFASAGILIGRKGREGRLPAEKKAPDAMRRPATPASNRADALHAARLAQPMVATYNNPNGGRLGGVGCVNR
jgi:hypothetical protein